MMFVWIKMLFFISNTSPSLIREPGECCEDMVRVRREHKVCCQSSGHISIHAAKKKDNYVYTSSMAVFFTTLSNFSE